MKRRISVQTGGVFERFGPDEGMRLIGRAGFDCVDLGLDGCLPGSQIRSGAAEGVFTLPFEEFIGNIIKPIRDAGVRYGVGFGQAHAPFPTWTSADEAMNAFLLRSFEMCLDACQYLECPYLVVHPAFLRYQDRLDPDFERELNIRRYSGLIPAAKRTGVKILLENMFTSFGGRVIGAACSDMHDACGYIDTLNGIAGEEIFGFCYDSGHAALLGLDQGIAIRTLGHRILAVHLHDNDGQRDSHRFPYYGVIDWETVLRAFRETGYKGSINFETYAELDAHDSALIPKLLELLVEIGRLFVTKTDGA